MVAPIVIFWERRLTIIITDIHSCDSILIVLMRKKRKKGRIKRRKNFMRTMTNRRMENRKKRMRRIIGRRKC